MTGPRQLRAEVQPWGKKTRTPARGAVQIQGLNESGLAANNWGQGIKSAWEQKGLLDADLGWGTTGA